MFGKFSHQALRPGWPARGTPEAQFPATAAETAGGTAGENGGAGGVPGALLGKLPRDCWETAVVCSSRQGQSPGSPPSSPPGSPRAVSPAMLPALPPSTPICPGSPPSNLRSNVGELGTLSLGKGSSCISAQRYAFFSGNVRAAPLQDETASDTLFI